MITSRRGQLRFKTERVPIDRYQEGGRDQGIPNLAGVVLPASHKRAETTRLALRNFQTGHLIDIQDLTHRAKPPIILGRIRQGQSGILVVLTSVEWVGVPRGRRTQEDPTILVVALRYSVQRIPLGHLGREARATTIRQRRALGDVARLPRIPIIGAIAVGLKIEIIGRINTSSTDITEDCKDIGSRFYIMPHRLSSTDIFWIRSILCRRTHTTRSPIRYSGRRVGRIHRITLSHPGHVHRSITPEIRALQPTWSG
ncbi:MAG: hypothetical protein GY696_04285 [Gammaproteobacteria bacterium]|nr:hypothetical protein [Gammaproteobacteria bacterium]